MAKARKLIRNLLHCTIGLLIGHSLSYTLDLTKHFNLFVKKAKIRVHNKDVDVISIKGKWPRQSYEYMYLL